MTASSPDSHYDFFRQAYKRLPTETLLGLLSNPPAIDCSLPAAIAELSARGKTREELLPYLQAGANQSRREGDADAIMGWLDAAFDL